MLLKRNTILICCCFFILPFALKAEKKAILEKVQKPLLTKKFSELPLGSIQAEGWLKERLIRQKNGLTGHLDELYPIVMGKNNGWLGGDGDQWERGPYWIDGLVPLAYILQDDTLKRKAQKWIDWTLSSQQQNGYFGPAKSYKEEIPGVQRDNADDWWPKMVMLKVLQQYYTATLDKRVIPFLTNYFHYQLNELPNKPLDFRTFWAKYRGGDNLMVVLWLYNITKDEFLLKLADMLYDQTFDFGKTFQTKNWWATGSMHCVNLAQGLKTPAIYAQYKNRESNLSILKSGFNDIKTFLGYPHGGFGGDEALHGNNPTQGTELCTLVEYMFSLEKIFQIAGDIDYVEQVERIAFNALPAQSDDEYMNRQYFQQTNQVRVTKCDRNFDTNHSGSDILFGLLNGYPCCTSNMHQGFPKFVQNLWYKTNDNGLAALMYAPSKVKTTLNGVEINIEEETEYPFEEKIVFHITPEKAISFPFYLRAPSWCDSLLVKINSEKINIKSQNGVFCVNRVWKKNDKVELFIPMNVKITRWYERSATVERGPLVYALKMQENFLKKPFVGEDAKWQGKDYWEITSHSPWNYALIKCPESDIQKRYKIIRNGKTPLFPWNVDNSPVSIITTAKRIPNWTLYNESAGPLPYSIGYGMPVGETDSITLIPYGCTKLRITEFPLTGQYTIK